MNGNYNWFNRYSQLYKISYFIAIDKILIIICIFLMLEKNKKLNKMSNAKIIYFFCKVKSGIYLEKFYKFFILYIYGLIP